MTGLSVLVLLAVLDAPARTVPRDVEWTHAIAEGRVGVATMVREIRQADAIDGATPNRVDFELSAGGSPRRVMYSCDVAGPTGGLRRCTRLTAAPGGALPDPATGTVVVDRVRNGTPADPAFTSDPDPVAPRHVGVRILVPASGERQDDGAPSHPVVMEDGAYLRNRDLGG